MHHCFKWPAHRTIEHIAAAKLNRIRDVLSLARLFIHCALGQNMTNLALCGPSPSPMLAEWSQLVGPATGFVRKADVSHWSVESPSRLDLSFGAGRGRPRIRYLSRTRARWRETRSYNFGIFAYLFNSLFDPRKNSWGYFTIPRRCHIYFEIYLTSGSILKFASLAGRMRLLAGPQCQWLSLSYPAR
jgi:hypothetical protein